MGRCGVEVEMPQERRQHEDAAHESDRVAERRPRLQRDGGREPEVSFRHVR